MDGKLLEIILIRHCLTDCNKEGKYAGNTDVPLNKEGIGQARLIAGYLKDKKISAVYSGDLSRTFETASIIAENHSLKVKRDPRFNEIDFGEWEKLTFEQIEKKYPELAKEYIFNPFETKIPKGEPFPKFRKRILSALADVFKKEKGTIAVVSHGGVNKIVLCELLGIPLSSLWQIEQSVGAINIIEVYEGISVISLMNRILWEN